MTTENRPELKPHLEAYRGRRPLRELYLVVPEASIIFSYNHMFPKPINEPYELRFSQQLDLLSP